jgi:hypothetical protein
MNLYWHTSWVSRLLLSYLSICFYVSLSLALPSISPKPNRTLNMTAADPPTHTLSLSLLPLLFQVKKFPVEAHFWLDKLFYYKDFIIKPNNITLVYFDEFVSSLFKFWWNDQFTFDEVFWLRCGIQYKSPFPLLMHWIQQFYAFLKRRKSFWIKMQIYSPHLFQNYIILTKFEYFWTLKTE